MNFHVYCNRKDCFAWQPDNSSCGALVTPPEDPSTCSFFKTPEQIDKIEEQVASRPDFNYQTELLLEDLEKYQITEKEIAELMHINRNKARYIIQRPYMREFKIIRNLVNRIKSRR